MVELNPVLGLAWAGIFAVSWLLSLMMLRLSAISLFRYKLWQLRDLVIDSVRSGQLPRTLGVKDFIEVIDSTIQCAESITLAKWLIIPTGEGSGRKRPYDVMVAEMSAEQREFFERRFMQFRYNLAKYLLLGTAFGFVVFLIAISAFSLMSIGQNFTNPIPYIKKRMVNLVAKLEKIISFLNSSGPPASSVIHVPMIVQSSYR